MKFPIPTDEEQREIFLKGFAAGANFLQYTQDELDEEGLIAWYLYCAENY